MIKTRTIPILLILTVSLVAGWFLLWSPNAPWYSDTELTYNNNTSLFDVPVDEISVFIITLENGTTLSIQRQSDNTWLSSENSQIILPSDTVELTLSVLISTPILREVAAGQDTAMGLSVPTLIINLILANADQHELIIGDVNSIGNGYYVNLDGNRTLLADYDSIFTVLDTIYMSILPSFLPTTVSPLQSPQGPTFTSIP
jgi:hypothetical protein